MVRARELGVGQEAAEPARAQLSVALRWARDDPTMRWLLAVLLFCGACVVVRPYEREILSKRIMLFQPDPHEDVLDLHMLEAREGAVGGYGSAGGGCGCN